MSYQHIDVGIRNAFMDDYPEFNEFLREFPDANVTISTTNYENVFVSLSVRDELVYEIEFTAKDAIFGSRKMLEDAAVEFKKQMMERGL